MTYEQAIEYIHATYKFGSKLGLENMTRLLELLSNPERDLKVIHIAGTNGKGSTASFFSHCLQSGGYEVGMYISPYLETFNERIQINGLMISDDDLAFHTERIKQCVDQLLALGFEHPTEFEIVTAIGFDYFKHKKVDFVVLEVGLGGRLDSTNVIMSPIACIITPIGMDHTQYLGDTIEKIAFEKAGIIKSGVLVVSTNQQPEALAVIKRQCLLKSSHFVLSNHDESTIIRMDPTKTLFQYRGQLFEIKLLGEHQIQNACTVIDAIYALNDLNLLSLTYEEITKGLKDTSWPGRFECVLNRPKFYIDAAHNLHGVHAMKKAMNLYNPSDRKIAIFGMMADKDVYDVLAEISSSFERFYLVVPDNPRAMGYEALEGVLRQVGYQGQVHRLINLEEIKELLILQELQDITFYCFGSLYYIGEVRKLIKSLS